MSADQMSSVILTFFGVSVMYPCVSWLLHAVTRQPYYWWRWPRGPRMPGPTSDGETSLHSAALSHDHGKSPQT